jgi:hypothetical protein
MAELSYARSGVPRSACELPVRILLPLICVVARHALIRVRRDLHSRRLLCERLRHRIRILDSRIRENRRAHFLGLARWRPPPRPRAPARNRLPGRRDRSRPHPGNHGGAGLPSSPRSDRDSWLQSFRPRKDGLAQRPLPSMPSSTPNPPSTPSATPPAPSPDHSAHPFCF